MNTWTILNDEFYGFLATAVDTDGELRLSDGTDTVSVSELSSLKALRNLLDAANLVIEARGTPKLRACVDALEHKLNSLGVGL